MEDQDKLHAFTKFLAAVARHQVKRLVGEEASELAGDLIDLGDESLLNKWLDEQLKKPLVIKENRKCRGRYRAVLRRNHPSPGIVGKISINVNGLEVGYDRNFSKNGRISYKSDADP